MSQIVSIHSYCGGTGKSNIIANLSALLAMGGKRVGVIDANFQSPGVHYLFGLDEKEWPCSLTDYLQGRCAVAQTTLDVTPLLGPNVKGKLFLTPSSTKASEIVRMLRDGHGVSLLSDGFWALIERLELDVLMIDSRPGLDEDSLVSIAASDVLVIVLRPNRKDFQGTDTTVHMARRLNVPRLMLIANMVPSSFAPADFKRVLEQTYKCEVAAVLPYYDEMMALYNESLFVLNRPDHPMTNTLKQVVVKLVS